VRSDFRDEFDRVHSSLVTMARAAREAMRQATAALLTADRTIAQGVILRDSETDVLYRVVEDRVYDLLERGRPDPGDLRLIMTALRVASDLERMSGLAAHVARTALRRHPAPAVGPELGLLFREMGTVADELADKVVQALAGQDARLGGELDGDDDAMDELHRRLFGVMVRPDWPLGVEAAIDGALLGRYYERYADHAVNVGRHVVFLVTGKPAE
jgi:phosphate transport system protein